jgi:phage terminase large subunit
MIYSNMSHNKFVPDKVRNDLIRKGKANPEFKKVYLLGKTGQTEGVIFPNVAWVQEMPENIKKESYGMDFGFTNDPTTLVHIALSDGIIYCKALIYERGLTSSDIVKKLRELGIPKSKYIFADGASPQTIAEIRRQGHPKIIPARKGSGSIKSGIDLVKTFGKLHIVDNIHWRGEQISYKWIEDKTSGLLTNKPIDDYNHLWDALRYGMQGIVKRSVSANYT